MLDDSLRRRLEALNRSALPAEAQRTRTAPIAPQVPRVARPKPVARQQTALHGLHARGRVVENALGSHLLVEIPLSEVWADGDELLTARHAQLVSAADLANEQGSFLGAFPSRFLALDLETCGLSGSALFLVGLARQVGEQLLVELLFARNYAEEPAVLGSLADRLSEVDTLVTFNGKSFDWPMVSDRWHRYLLHRTRPLPELVHYDVLHHARRRWKATLPDCKLQTIERMICRRSRTGDIPGHQIPAAYDHYVQTGHTGEMDQVLYHNGMDLVTLVDVAMRLAG
ncbi:ribonuclease H-like domain-containing protein [Aeoliella mucimassa]|nr:ribonuclease H-like domain-containing protein [Aeoliella mucimassa]